MPRAFTEQQRSQIRDTLLAAGRDAVLATGFRRVSVAQLARAAGISKGSFYSFFDRKEALFTALLADAEATLRGELVAVASSSLPRDERIRAVLAGIFGGVRKHPMLRALADPEELAWLARSLGPEVMRAARRDDDRFFGELARSLDLHLADGVLTGIAGLALAVAVHRSLLGDDGGEAVIALVIDGLVVRLSALSETA